MHVVLFKIFGKTSLSNKQDDGDYEEDNDDGGGGDDDDDKNNNNNNNNLEVTFSCKTNMFLH